MGQGVEPRNAAGRQVPGQVSPRVQPRCEAGGEPGQVKQNRFASFLDGKPAQPGSVHLRRTEQLGGGAKLVEAVRILAKAEGYRNFFVSDGGYIRRKGRVRLAPVVAGSPFDGDFQQPLRNALPGPAGMREPMEQPGEMGSIAQRVGERWRRQGLLLFHGCDSNRGRPLLKGLFWLAHVPSAPTDSDLFRQYRGSLVGDIGWGALPRALFR